MLRLGVLLIILRLGASAALPSTGTRSSTNTFENLYLHVSCHACCSVWHC